MEVTAPTKSKSGMGYGPTPGADRQETGVQGVPLEFLTLNYVGSLGRSPPPHPRRHGSVQKNGILINFR